MPRQDDPLSRLRRHAYWVGAERAAKKDPTAAYLLDALQHFLSVAQAAMEDEDVPPQTAVRILDRLIYGCVPNPIQSAERERLMSTFGALLHRTPHIIPIPLQEEES